MTIINTVVRRSYEMLLSGPYNIKYRYVVVFLFRWGVRASTTKEDVSNGFERAFTNSFSSDLV